MFSKNHWKILLLVWITIKTCKTFVRTKMHKIMYKICKRGAKRRLAPLTKHNTLNAWVREPVSKHFGNLRNGTITSKPNLTFLTLPKHSNIVIFIFKGNHRKNDVELSSFYGYARWGTPELSRDRVNICLVRGAKSSLSTASTYFRYFLHIFVNFSANESFAHVFIDNHTKCKSYFSDF